MFVGSRLFNRPALSLLVVRKVDPLRPHGENINRTKLSAADSATIIWYRLEDLRRQQRNAHDQVHTGEQRHDVLSRECSEMEAAPASPARDERLGKARKALAECQLQLKQAHDAIRETGREIDRQIDCLRQLHVEYDAKTGQFTSDKGGDTVNVLDLTLNFLHDAYTHQTRRQERKKTQPGGPETALNELMALLGGTADDANGVGAAFSRDAAPQRVRAWVKTQTTVGGMNGVPLQILEGCAPVEADESDVGLDGYVGVAYAAGIHGGWNQRQSLVSPQALHAIVR